MRWSDRYNWFVSGLIIGLLGAGVVFSTQCPLEAYFIVDQLEEVSTPWVAGCVVLAVVWKLVRQVWLDRRPGNVYKDEE